MLTNSVNCHLCTNHGSKFMMRNSQQLLLSLISTLLLIGVGLIGFGKKTGLSTM
jgi:hypothetical protein